MSFKLRSRHPMVVRRSWSQVGEQNKLDVSEEKAVMLVQALFAGPGRLADFLASQSKSDRELFVKFMKQASAATSNAAAEADTLAADEEVKNSTTKVADAVLAPVSIVSTLSTIVHSICVAEFDELKGNTLSIVYPESAKGIKSHTNAQIAELCLPDGGHLFRHDATYLVLRSVDDEELFGCAVFRNRPDATQKRGARQLALLLIATEPRLDYFEALLTPAVDRYLDMGEDAGVIAQLYKTLAHAEALRPALLRPTAEEVQRGSGTAVPKSGPNIETLPTLELWGKLVHPPQVRALVERNHFGGASLLTLLTTFRESTMALWLAIITQRRVLFSGHAEQARTVGRLVISTPLLVGPFAPLIDAPLPYVCLADTSVVERSPVFVCGTTNGLFATKAQWFDVVADVKEGTVTASSEARESAMLPSGASRHTKVASRDAAFAENLLKCIVKPGFSRSTKEKDLEEWLRAQFYRYTFEFMCEADKAASSLNPIVPASSSPNESQSTVRKGLHLPYRRRRGSDSSQNQNTGPSLRSATRNGVQLAAFVASPLYMKLLKQRFVGEAGNGGNLRGATPPTRVKKGPPPIPASHRSSAQYKPATRHKPQPTSVIQDSDTPGSAAALVKPVPPSVEVQGTIRMETFPDGTQVQTDVKTGFTIKVLPDGTKIDRDANGYEVVAYPNGHKLVVQSNPSGCVIEQWMEGTGQRKRQTNTDGSCIETFPDGRQVHTSADGEQLEMMLDGTQVRSKIGDRPASASELTTQPIPPPPPPKSELPPPPPPPHVPPPPPAPPPLPSNGSKNIGAAKSARRRSTFVRDIPNVPPPPLPPKRKASNATHQNMMRKNSLQKEWESIL